MHNEILNVPVLLHFPWYWPWNPITAELIASCFTAINWEWNSISNTVYLGMLFFPFWLFINKVWRRYTIIISQLDPRKWLNYSHPNRFVVFTGCPVHNQFLPHKFYKKQTKKGTVTYSQQIKNGWRFINNRQKKVRWPVHNKIKMGDSRKYPYPKMGSPTSWS